jgi:hypothetical protein
MSLLSKIDSDRRYQKLYLIALIEAVVLIGLSVIYGGGTSDTDTYYAAWDTICSGKIDAFRTPLYPVFIGLAKAVFGDFAGKIVVWIIQSAIFLCSIKWMKFLSEYFISNRKIAFLVTAFYAIFPGPLVMNAAILTESLALTGMVGLLYLTVKLYERQQPKYMAWITLLLVALIMLRPAFSYLPVIYAGLWIVAFFSHQFPKRICLLGGLSVIVVISIVVGYTLQMKRTYGIMTLSGISLDNNYFAVRTAGVIDPEELSDTVTRKVVADVLDNPFIGHRGYDYWVDVYRLHQSLTLTQIDTLVSTAVDNHSAEIARFILFERLNDACSNDVINGGAITPPVKMFTRLVNPNISTSYAILVIFFFISLWPEIRHRLFSILKWLLVVHFISLNVVVILGAPSEWCRLLMPNYPTLLLIFGMTLQAAVTILQERKIDSNAEE